MSRGGKQETLVGGLQGEDEGPGAAKIRAETKADTNGPQPLRKSRGHHNQLREERPLLTILEPEREVRNGAGKATCSESWCS